MRRNQPSGLSSLSGPRQGNEPDETAKQLCKVTSAKPGEPSKAGKFYELSKPDEDRWQGQPDIPTELCSAKQVS